VPTNRPRRNPPARDRTCAARADTWGMSAAHQLQRPEDLLDRESTPPEDLAPVVERLEVALGGDLTRFLLSALAGDHVPSRDEPR
jgi:hypothetical protein